MTIDAMTLSKDEYEIAKAEILKSSNQAPPVGDDVRKLSSAAYNEAKRDILKKLNRIGGTL
jgi:hypothetical protein